jgi:hypothetical protein
LLPEKEILNIEKSLIYGAGTSSAAVPRNNDRN